MCRNFKCRSWKTVVVSVFCIAASGCEGDSPMRAIGPLTPMDKPDLRSGGSISTLLATDTRPLQAAMYRADSVAFPIALGKVQLRGRSGDRVSLSARLEEALLQAVEGQERVIAVVNGASRAYSLEELSRGITVYQFLSEATVDIQYFLARSVRLQPDGLFELIQITNADILSAITPWATASGESLGSGAVALTCATSCQSCPFSAATGQCGATAYSITPYAVGSPFCCFQSTDGSGASSVITITFSSPVSNVTIAIKDPTYAGNTMTAYGPAGELVGSGSFSYTGVPGQYSEDTLSISGEISSVVLTPAAADYVAYSGDFTAESLITLDCTPVMRGDPVNCTAAATNPSEQLSVTQWSFTATSGQMVDRTVNPASLTWSGVVAIGGTVRVAGTVGGVTDSATAVLSVTARSWTKTTVKDHTIVNPSTLADRPANMEELGNFVGTLPTDSNVSRWLGTIQDDGPNHGFTYMLDLPPVTTTVAQVNGNAINGTSIFYQVQEPRRKKIQGLWYCPQSVVTGVLFSLVEKHEGAVTPPETYQYSHAALFRADVDTKANQRYEPVVGFEAQDVVGPVSATLQSEANQKSLNMHFDGTNYLNTQSLGNCETFHFTYPP